MSAHTMNAYCIPQAEVEWLSSTLPRACRDGDIYWSATGGGLEEKRHVYVDGNHLPERFRGLGKSSFQVFELGFGFGLNFLLTASTWSQYARAGQILHYVAVDRSPVAPSDLKRLLQQVNISNRDRLIEIYPAPVAGMHTVWFQPDICLHLYLGDAEALLDQDLLQGIDCIYLDGFSPGRNPDAWDAGVISKLAAAASPGATVSTYSVAGHVRRSLAAAGFDIRRQKGYGQKKEMLTATLQAGLGPAEPLVARPTSVAVVGGGLGGQQIARSLARRGIDCTLFDNGGGRLPMYALSPQVSLNVTPGSRLSLLGTQFTNNHLNVQRIGLERYLSRERRTRLATLLHDEVATTTDQGLFYPSGGFLHRGDLFDMSAPSRHRASTTVRHRDGTAGRHRVSTAGRHQESTAGSVYKARVESVAESGDEVVITCRDEQGQVEVQAFSHVYLAVPDRTLALLTPLPLTYVWGQSIEIETNTAGAGPVIADGASLIPGPSGFHVSATFDRDQPPGAEPRYEDTERLIQHFHRVHPHLRIRRITPMTGQRVTTPDRVPVVGPAPDWRALKEYCARRNHTAPFSSYSNRVGILTGLGSHGTTLAPLCAEFLVASMLGEPPVLTRDLATVLLPTRFQLRQVGRLQLPG